MLTRKGYLMIILGLFQLSKPVWLHITNQRCFWTCNKYNKIILHLRKEDRDRITSYIKIQ